MMKKKFRVVLIVALSLLMVFVSAIGCNGNNNVVPTPGGDEGWEGNWDGPGFEPDEPLVHVCVHACYVCEKCINIDCVDVSCKVKCYETDSENRKEYIFNGTDSRVKKEGGVNVEGDHLGNINQNSNAVITYNIIAPSDVTVSLGVSVSEMPESNLITSDTPITINGKDFYSRGELKGGSTSWVKFVTTWLGCATLQKGENIIQFSNPHSDGQQFNFKDLMFLSPVELEWGLTTEIHECATKNQAGKCTNYSCNKSDCLDKDETGWKLYNINGKDDEVLKYYIENGVEKPLWNDAETEKCIGFIANNDWGQKIIWSFNSTSETYVRLAIETSTNLNNSLFNEVWNLSFNGQNIDTQGMTKAPEGDGGWAVYTFGSVAYVKAKAGKNTFMMEHKSTLSGYNLRSLNISYAQGEIVKAQAEKPEDAVPPTTDDVSYYFEGETADFAAGVLGDIRIANDDAGARGKTSLQNVNNNTNASLTYKISATDACLAKLYVNLALGTQTVSGIFVITVNGAEVIIPNSLSAVGTPNWITFEEFWMADVNLIQGENVIVITVKGGCGNYDYMKLLSSSTLTSILAS